MIIGSTVRHCIELFCETSQWGPCRLKRKDFRDVEAFANSKSLAQFKYRIPPLHRKTLEIQGLLQIPTGSHGSNRESRRKRGNSALSNHYHRSSRPPRPHHRHNQQKQLNGSGRSITTNATAARAAPSFSWPKQNNDNRYLGNPMQELLHQHRVRPLAEAARTAARPFPPADGGGLGGWQC